ncbi:MAG TPA: DUF2283 domain-containing protein [Caldilineae bacterium]|nr:DUF2283 domain-containing protein [Caldilineae bacterium]
MEETRTIDPLTAKYDAEQDVLYLLFTDKAKEAVAEEVGDEVFVRFDAKTRRIVGMEFLNFQERIIGMFGPELIYEGVILPGTLSPLVQERLSPSLLREPMAEYSTENNSERSDIEDNLQS